MEMGVRSSIKVIPDYISQLKESVGFMRPCLEQSNSPTPLE